MDPVKGLPDFREFHTALRDAGSVFCGVHGTDIGSFRIVGVSTQKAPVRGTLLFASAPDEELGCRLAAADPCVVIVPVGYGDALKAPDRIVLEAEEPRYAYAVLLRALVPVHAERGMPEGSIGRYTVISEGARLGSNVTVEDFVSIASGSEIGDGCYLMRGVSIGPRVKLGKNCVVKENAVIGDAGFGFGMSKGKPHIRIPQLGGVCIHDDVEVGACTSIASGTIDPTVIMQGVKISNHVHIAHNCVVGERTIITCGVSISGSTCIGSDCWLAPQAVFRNKLTIGDGAFIGMGAVVVKDVASGAMVMGNPAAPKGDARPKGDT